ncbi:MAG: hypothetical protein Q9178_000478 [Gyalolechia marmorata]
MSPNPLFFIVILVMLNLSLVHASPATPAKVNSASTSSDTILQLDPGFSEPFPNANVSDPDPDPPDCYAQTRTPGLPRFYPVQRKDCIELVFQMVTRPHSTLAFEWDPNRMTFPIRFRLGTCSVSLYADAARTSDVFSVIAVARVAGLIVNQCATREKAYLGGRLEIGARNAFWVSVIGRPR